MRIANHKPRSVEAFTLVEVLIALAVIGGMFVAFYSALSWGFAVISSTRESLRATQIGLEKMETMRMYSWDQVNSNGYIPTNFTAPFYPPVAGSTNTNSAGVTFYGSTIIQAATNMPASYSNDMRLVTVTVFWTNKNVVRTRQMQTYISQYGMQRYIY